MPFVPVRSWPSIVTIVRRVVARRPWLQWVVIALLALAVAASVADAMARLDDERAAWGTAVDVWVATVDVEVGDPIPVERRSIPAAVRPSGAVDERADADGVFARQAIGRGEIVTDLDVMAADDELALTPPGWLVAPVRESLPSGAALGERVRVVSDGFVVADAGTVVGFVDDVTLVAVPADVAPRLPAAADITRVALLRIP